MQNPSEYGIVTFDASGHAIFLEEKPTEPRSNFAVPGLYLYDASVIEIARGLKPSQRGEYEITDVNREYLRRGQLNVQRLSRGFVWLDAGSSSTLHEASSYVEMIERRQGTKLGCPEEAALVRGFLSADQLSQLTKQMPACEYKFYLETILHERIHSQTN